MCPYIQIILPSYGVLAFVGGFAALLFTYLRLDRFQIAFTQLLKIVVVCIIGCVLGSKLMYALTQIPWLVENFSLENLVLFIPSSGYVFYGGLLGVILAISLYTRKDRDLRTRIPTIPRIWTDRLLYGWVLLWYTASCPDNVFWHVYA